MIQINRYCQKGKLLPTSVILTHLSVIACNCCAHETGIAVNLLYVNEHTMLSAQKQYRNRNYPTDVLAFPYDQSFNNWDDQYYNIGEIWWCSPLVSLSDHTNTFLYIHSFLHLLGYDHKNKDDEKIMIDKENQILSNIDSYYAKRFNCNA